MSETPAPAEPDPKPQLNAPAGSRLDHVARWLALAANVGVVLGLILVIVEVRQNAELTRTQMEQRKNDFLAEIEFSLATRESAEVWVKAIRTPESLTDAEMKMVEAHLVSLMLQWDHLFQMERSGLVTRAHVRQHIANSAPLLFRQPFRKELVAAADARLAGDADEFGRRADRRGTGRPLPGRFVRQNADCVAASAGIG